MTKSLYILLFLLGTAAFPAISWAAEEILFFGAEVVVYSDGIVRITESIKVRAEGKKIGLGILRDLPASYKYSSGESAALTYDIKMVLLNGEPASHQVKSFPKGQRIYIYEENVVLKPGVYTYTIQYYVENRLSRFEDRDELRLNVTGQWSFPIRSALAIVRLPSAIPRKELTIQGFVSEATEEGRDHRHKVMRDGSIKVRPTRQLKPKESFTMVISWPKGFIEQNTR